MTGCHGSLLHSVKDPPPLVFHFTPFSFSYSASYFYHDFYSSSSSSSPASVWGHQHLYRHNLLSLFTTRLPSPPCPHLPYRVGHARCRKRYDCQHLRERAAEDRVSLLSQKGHAGPLWREATESRYCSRRCPPRLPSLPESLEGEFQRTALLHREQSLPPSLVSHGVFLLAVFSERATSLSSVLSIKLQKQVNNFSARSKDTHFGGLFHSARDLARRHSQRLFCTSLITPAPLIDRKHYEDMAMFRWLDNLGRIYGASLMFLVGFGYWIQGFRCFPWLAVNFYFKDVLTVDPGTLQIVQNTVNLPMVAKPVYGIVSDSVYIRGAHRVPYLVIGGFLQALSWGVIAVCPGGGSSVIFIAALLALSNLGASMVDVANDALVAECAKKKKSTGELQSFAWFSTAVGGVLGNLIAALALSHIDLKLMFGVFGVLLILQVVKSMGANEDSFGLKIPHTINGDIEKRNDIALDVLKHAKKRPAKLLINHVNGTDISPYALTLEATEDGWRQTGMNMVKAEPYVEEEPLKMPGMRQQFVDLVLLVKQPEIMYPLAWFMASYAMIPTLAGTMFYFQTQHLKVDPAIVVMAKVMGQVGLMGGSALYSRYLKGMPLRKLLVAIQVLLCFCMLFDIFLVKRINVELGIPDGVLVLGASAFVDALNQFKILPFMVLLAQLCPAGSEGSLLAAFMSSQCLATIISGYMGVTLASLLHISANDFSELPTGIFVQSMAALLPIMWISFLPEGNKVTTLQQHDGKNT